MNLVIINQLTKCLMILSIDIHVMFILLFFDRNFSILYICLFTSTTHKAKQFPHQSLYQYTNAIPVNNNYSAMY